MRVSERADKSGVGGLLEQRNKKIRMAGAAAEKKECCGCGACAQACPAGCIQMRQDQEGFRYPYIQKELCQNCGVCSMACPMEHPAQGLEHNRGGYCGHMEDGIKMRIFALKVPQAERFRCLQGISSDRAVLFSGVCWATICVRFI